MNKTTIPRFRFITARKVMFLHVSVILFTVGACVAGGGGMRGRGACVAEGCMAGECAWQGACMAGRACMVGACMAGGGGVHGRGGGMHGR